MSNQEKQFYIKRADGKYWAGGALEKARWVDSWQDASDLTSKASATALINGGVFSEERALAIEERED